MSVIEHLEALRRVLIVSFIAWGVATFAAFFISRPVIGWSLRSKPDHRCHASTGAGSIAPIRMEEFAFTQRAAPTAIDRAYAGAR